MGMSVDEWIAVAREEVEGNDAAIKTYAQAHRDAPRTDQENIFAYRLRRMFFDQLLERLK